MDKQPIVEWLNDAAKGFVDSIGMQMGSDAPQEKIDELGEFVERLTEAASLLATAEAAITECELALTTITEYPVPEQDNAPAFNMRSVAKRGLKHCAAYRAIRGEG